MANRAQGSQYPPLVRQGSLNNLTSDEVQSQLEDTGKLLHGMNLDELLKSVISAESGQLVQNPSAFSYESFLLGNIGLNGRLSNKPINEVLREFVHQEHVNTSMDNHLQQSCLGEPTLEQYLARAGVINNVGNQDNVVSDTKPLIALDPMVMASQQDNWLPLQMQMQTQVPSIHVHQLQHQELQQKQNHQQIIGMCPDFSDSKPVFNMEMGYSDNPLAISIPVAAMSSSTCLDSKETVVGRKRRFSDEMLEKTIERREKRMAKNRESAAKSRAKKQAYIDKLENDKLRLLKSNSWLMKLKDAEAQLLSAATLTPKYQLRRTSSNTF